MKAVTPKKTPIAAAPGFHSVVFDADQLSTQPFLDYLRDMINKAYQNCHIGLVCLEDPESQRFDTTDELSTELGVHGRCCLVFRDEDEQMRRPVASAMIKHSNKQETAPPPNSVIGAVDGDSSEIGGYEKEPEHVHDIEHWEVTAVAIAADDPSLAGLGLAAHSCGQLERDVRERMQASKLEYGDGSEVVQRNGSQTDDDAACVSDPSHCFPGITLWARATTRSNAPYWQRRGYDPFRVDVYPKGFWGAVEDIQVMILKKEVASTVPVPLAS